jgi:hypothetical protein
MADKPTSFPTYGYKPDGSAQIFDLEEEDGELPEGWSRQIEPWNHPNSRHLHSRPAETIPEHLPAPEEEPYSKKRRGRPPKSHENDEEPGAELASELRDY